MEKGGKMEKGEKGRKKKKGERKKGGGGGGGGERGRKGGTGEGKVGVRVVHSITTSFTTVQLSTHIPCPMLEVHSADARVLSTI